MLTKFGYLIGFSFPIVSMFSTKDKVDLVFYLDHTGIIFTAAAIGMPRKPIVTLANHWDRVRGQVFAKLPRNSIIMIWKITVQVRTAKNT